MTVQIWCTSLLYWMLALIIIFPPEEAVSAGITIEALFKFWLGSEISSFINYQIKRTTITIIVHSLLIPGHILTLWWFHPWIVEYMKYAYCYACFEYLLLLSLAPVLIACLVILKWSQNNWRKHPLVQNILLYSSIERPLNIVAANIDSEFIRIDKFSSHQNSVSCIVATNSWLIKIASYKVNLIALEDAVLVLNSSEESVYVANDSSQLAQYLVLNATSVKKGINPFSFRINSTQLRELELKLVNPVINTKQIVVHQSLSDQFARVFEETVNKNPKLHLQVQDDMCIGCMSLKANVQLIRRCQDVDSMSECVSCSCRPMWCLTCLSKWFAARQDQTRPETWLSSRAPCPTCRSSFCLLDVCIISDHS